MELKTLFPTTVAALAVGLAALALVACGGDASSELPTLATSSAETTTTFDASDLTAADDGGAATAPDSRPPGPPEEALAACDGLAAEASCSFASPRDGSTIDGTCHARRDDPSQFVCFPSDWSGRGEPGRGQQGPPEEALAACQGIETGAACSFEAPFGTVEGTCGEGLGNSGQIACRPEWAEGAGPFGPGPGNGRGPGGEGRQQAASACEGLQADTACSFESPHGAVAGTCRTGRDGSTLVCAPADWPRR